MPRLRHISLSLLGIFLLFSCKDSNYYKLSGYAQGGTYSVKYRGCRIRPEKLQLKVDSLLREIDFTLSGYNPSSTLTRFNAGDTITLSPMFFELYSLSYDMWEETDGKSNYPETDSSK